MLDDTKWRIGIRESWALPFVDLSDLNAAYLDEAEPLYAEIHLVLRGDA